jgi:hypothetical protein
MPWTGSPLEREFVRDVLPNVARADAELRRRGQDGLSVHEAWRDFVAFKAREERGADPEGWEA